MGYDSRRLKIIQSPGGIIGDLIYEEIDQNGIPQYAIKRKDTVKIEPHLELSEGFMYTPINPPYWTLPPPPQPYGTQEQLFTQIRNYIYQHVDFEIDIQYDIYSAWIMATWVPERFDSVGYLWFTGPKNSGKTRAGIDVLAQLVRRPLPSPSVSGASIYRAIEAFEPTFLLDEFEIYKKQLETKAEVIGVFNAGYRRGQVVLRTDKVVDGAPQLRGFRVFGFKSIVSIEDLPSALGSRCICFVMSKATRKIRRLIDKVEAANLRSMLLQFRFDTCFTPPLEANPIDLPDGRLVELYLPIILMAPKPLEEKVLTYAKHGYNQSIEEERDTSDAKIFLAILDLEKEELRAKILQTDIRDRVNFGVSEKDALGKTYVGKVLKRLGFDSKLNRDRQREVVVKAEVLSRRVERYVVAEEREAVDALIKRLYTNDINEAQKQLHINTLINTDNTNALEYTNTKQAQNEPLSPSNEPLIITSEDSKPSPSINVISAISVISESPYSTSNNISKDISKVKAVEELKQAYQGLECGGCHRKKIVIRYKATFLDETAGFLLLCQDCGVELMKEMRRKVLETQK